MSTVNEYYTHSDGVPAQLTRGSSSAIRAEFDAIEAAFFQVGVKLAAATASVDFNLIYQGSLTADPTVRYDGTALQDGDLYFNATDKVMKTFLSGTWYAPPSVTNIVPASGGTFTGAIFGTSATFSSSLQASGFIGSGAGLTGLTLAQITNALGYVPLKKTGDSMTGQLNGTVIILSGSLTAQDVTITSDEKRKMKWRAITSDVLDQFAAMKKVGFYKDKKTHEDMVGVGMQSLREIMPEAVTEDGVRYGQAALAMLQPLIKRVQELEKKLEQK